MSLAPCQHTRKGKFINHRTQMHSVAWINWNTGRRPNQNVGITVQYSLKQKGTKYHFISLVHQVTVRWLVRMTFSVNHHQRVRLHHSHYYNWNTSVSFSLGHHRSDIRKSCPFTTSTSTSCKGNFFTLCGDALSGEVHGTTTDTVFNDCHVLHE